MCVYKYTIVHFIKRFYLVPCAHISKILFHGAASLLHSRLQSFQILLISIFVYFSIVDTQKQTNPLGYLSIIIFAYAPRSQSQQPCQMDIYVHIRSCDLECDEPTDYYFPPPFQLNCLGDNKNSGACAYINILRKKNRAPIYLYEILKMAYHHCQFEYECFHAFEYLR